VAETDDDTLLTVNETARRLSISRARLYELIREGRVRTVKVGHLTRIRPRAIRAYIDALDGAA
jgi:excisionase family DNA binding protein